MNGKVCLVTGTTSGIGFEIASALAGKGATVLCANRDRDRGAAALERIRAASGNDAVFNLVADLSIQAQVRALADEVLEGWDRLDVLVNNAGGVFRERTLTPDGREYTWALDHLAYFLLTDLLLDRLRASAPSRVVCLASEAQKMGHLEFGDLEGETSYKGLQAYMQAKLANVAFTVELAERLQGTGVVANAVHPGAVATRFGLDGPAWLKWIMRAGKPLMRSPAKGAQTAIWLASAPETGDRTGGYWSDMKPLVPNPEALDPAIRARLWSVSEEQTAASP